MKIGDHYVFPLSMLEAHGMNGYYIDRQGDVYSTRQSPNGRKMTGSNGYVTLNGVSYNKRVLLLRAKVHREFLIETAKSKADIVTIVAKDEPASWPSVSEAREVLNAPKDRSHAKSVAEGIKSRGWVIAQVATHEGVQHLMFGSKPAINTTADSYTNELTRLASAKPGTKFVALKIVSAVVSGGLSWE